MRLLSNYYITTNRCAGTQLLSNYLLDAAAQERSCLPIIHCLQLRSRENARMGEEYSCVAAKTQEWTRNAAA